MPHKISKKGKRRLLYGSLAGIILLLVVVISFPYASQYLDTTTPTTPTTKTTFVIVDGASGEIISDICELDIYVPRSTSIFAETDDYYDISLFEIEENNKDANDISLDLSSYEAVWVVLSADTPTIAYWTEDWKIVYPNSLNTPRQYSAHHRSSDIYGNILNDTDGSVFSGFTDGNYTYYLWFPTYTTTQYHWDTADNWDIVGDWDELSTATISNLRNENIYREQETVFDLDVDTADHSRQGDYNDVTNIPSIKLTFNASIGADASTTDINMTIDSDYDYYIEYSTTYAFINFMETWDTTEGVLTLPMEIEFGSQIQCTQIDIGRNEVLGNHFTDGFTFTSEQVLFTST